MSSTLTRTLTGLAASAIAALLALVTLPLRAAPA